MPLKDFMTTTATTKRLPAISGGKRGDPVTHLEDVSITPVMLASATGTHAIRQAIGIEGTAIQVFEIYTESHEHTDDSSTVTQLPDIVVGDRVITGGVTYNVRWAEPQAATSSFGQTLIIYLTKDKTA